MEVGAATAGLESGGEWSGVARGAELDVGPRRQSAAGAGGGQRARRGRFRRSYGVPARVRRRGERGRYGGVRRVSRSERGDA